MCVLNLPSNKTEVALERVTMYQKLKLLINGAGRSWSLKTVATVRGSQR